MDSLDRTLTRPAGARVANGVGLPRCTDRSKLRLPGIDREGRRMTKPLGRIPGPCAQGLITSWSS